MVAHRDHTTYKAQRTQRNGTVPLCVRVRTFWNVSVVDKDVVGSGDGGIFYYRVWNHLTFNELALIQLLVRRAVGCAVPLSAVNYGTLGGQKDGKRKAESYFTWEKQVKDYKRFCLHLWLFWAVIITICHSQIKDTRETQKDYGRSKSFHSLKECKAYFYVKIISIVVYISCSETKASCRISPSKQWKLIQQCVHTVKTQNDKYKRCRCEK